MRRWSLWQKENFAGTTFQTMWRSISRHESVKLAMAHNQGAGIWRRLRTRHMVPVLVAAVIVAGSIVFWQMLKEQEDRHIQEAVLAESGLISGHVSNEVDAHIGAINRMADRWEYRGRPSLQQWTQDAALNLVDFSGFLSIQWMDNRNQVQWIAPVAGNEAVLALDHTLMPERMEAMATAKRTGQATVTAPIELATGESGFVVYRPIFLDNDPNQFDGFIVGAFSANDMFDILLNHPIVEGYSVEIFNSGEPVYGVEAGDMDRTEDWQVSRSIPLGGRYWQVDV